MSRKTAKADVIPTSGVYRVWCSPEHYYIGRSSNIESRCAEHKAKIAASLRGREVSDETRAHLSESLKGRVFSDEHRANIAAAQRNRKPITEATREKMRAAQKRRQAREREVGHG